MFRVFKYVFRGAKTSPSITILSQNNVEHILNLNHYPNITSVDVSKELYSIRRYWNTKDKQLTHHVPRNFNEIDERNKESFLQVIDTFIELTRQRSGHVEFIDSALKYMKEFGVHKDLEAYKSLISVMPKGKLVPENFLQAEFMHYPKQQNCIINVLEQMEDNGK